MRPPPLKFGENESPAQTGQISTSTSRRSSIVRTPQLTIRFLTHSYLDSGLFLLVPVWLVFRWPPHPKTALIHCTLHNLLGRFFGAWVDASFFFNCGVLRLRTCHLTEKSNLGYVVLNSLLFMHRLNWLGRLRTICGLHVQYMLAMRAYRRNSSCQEPTFLPLKRRDLVPFSSLSGRATHQSSSSSSQCA